MKRNANCPTVGLGLPIAPNALVPESVGISIHALALEPAGHKLRFGSRAAHSSALYWRGGLEHLSARGRPTSVDNAGGRRSEAAKGCVENIPELSESLDAARACSSGAAISLSAT